VFRLIDVCPYKVISYHPSVLSDKQSAQLKGFILLKPGKFNA